MLFCPYCRLLLPTFRGFVLCDATKKPPKFGGFILWMHLSILEINTYYASFFLHGQGFFKKIPYLAHFASKLIHAKKPPRRLEKVCEPRMYEVLDCPPRNTISRVFNRMVFTS